MSLSVSNQIQYRSFFSSSRCGCRPVSKCNHASIRYDTSVRHIQSVWAACSIYLEPCTVSGSSHSVSTDIILLSIAARVTDHHLLCWPSARSAHVHWEHVESGRLARIVECIILIVIIRSVGILEPHTHPTCSIGMRFVVCFLTLYLSFSRIHIVFIFNGNIVRPNDRCIAGAHK